MVPSLGDLMARLWARRRRRVPDPQPVARVEQEVV
jgi:hypothetical protein